MLGLPKHFACYVQGTVGHMSNMLVVAESSGEWGLFWGPRDEGSGSRVIVNSKTKHSEAISRTSEVEYDFCF